MHRKKPQKHVTHKLQVSARASMSEYRHDERHKDWDCIQIFCRALRRRRWAGGDVPDITLPVWDVSASKHQSPQASAFQWSALCGHAVNACTHGPATASNGSGAAWSISGNIPPHVRSLLSFQRTFPEYTTVNSSQPDRKPTKWGVCDFDAYFLRLGPVLNCAPCRCKDKLRLKDFGISDLSDTQENLMKVAAPTKTQLGWKKREERMTCCGPRPSAYEDPTISPGVNLLLSLLAAW